MMHRREVLSLVAGVALLDTLFRQELFAQSARPIALQWLREVHNQAATEIDNLDVAAAHKADGDLLRAPKLSVDEALRKYGKSHHG